MLIVGGPGSGKTTAAQQLATCLGVPHHNLDRVAFKPPEGAADAPFWQWTRTPYEDRCAWSSATAQQDRWVCDGIYAGWTLPLVTSAEVVLWLDVATMRCMGRVVRRALAHRVRGGKDWDLRSVRTVARGAREWARRPAATEAELAATDGANGGRTTAAFLEEYQTKVVRVRRPRDVRRAIRAACSAGEVTRPG